MRPCGRVCFSRYCKVFSIFAGEHNSQLKNIKIGIIYKSD